MFRSMFFSLVLLSVFVSFASAEKDKPATKAKAAKITKMDAKKGTVTVQMKSKGDDVEKMFKLAEEIEYMDSTGKVSTVEIFTMGDEVFIVEVDGKITKMKKKEPSTTTKKPESK